MRILHIVTAFPRFEGDVISPWLVELLKRLRATGVDAEVLTSSYKGARDGVFDGIPVFRFRYFASRWENLTHEETAPDRMRTSLFYKVLPAFFVAAGALAAFRHCRRHHYDVIHVHWPMPLGVLGWSARAGGAHRAALVMTFYGAELRLASRTRSLLRALLGRIIRSADRVVAISSYTAGEVRRVAEVPVEVIPYTVSLPTAPERDDGAVHDAAREFAVLFVGRLVERKGVAVLLRAVAELKSTRPVRLHIVGDGPERAALEQLAGELGIAARVRFHGRISDDALQAMYAAASVFALPAVVDACGDTEGLGVVLLEAMNWGVPVVASDTGGITDIVQPERTGLLVPPGDPVALASALDRLAADSALGVTLGHAGRDHLRRNFTWDSIVTRWLAVYEDAVLFAASQPAA